MPLSRAARSDRRRRVLMDTHQDTAKKKGRTPREVGDDAEEGFEGHSGARYSQDVRRACGQRLVQLIPVRRRSYIAIIGLSIAIPSLLIWAHYAIYVSGSLPWFGHPLAIPWDASRPNSIAAWLSSYVWLLCLGATVMTFQLRRHKLDDYQGEYRLWFWLVLTCLAASLNETTQILKFLGLALDHWSQLKLGWSGPALVSATTTALVGMLGLRLCSELKAVPGSLVFWLIGLAAWACSAALGQEEFRIDLSAGMRIWLKASMWLGGLTCIWLAALTFLRQIYIEAQQRFLLRSRLANRNSTPIGQRIKESIRKIPGIRRKHGEEFEREAGQDEENSKSKRGWNLLRRTRVEDADSGDDARHGKRNTRSKRQDASDNTEKNRTARHEADSAGSSAEGENIPSTKRGWRLFGRRKASEAEGQDTSQIIEADGSEENNSSKSNRGLRSWLRSPKNDDDADEYRKVRRDAPNSSSNEETEDGEPSEDESTKSKRRWRPKLPKPNLKMPKVGGWFAAIKMPSLRLKPPREEASTEEETKSPGLRPVRHSDEVPQTSATPAMDHASPDNDSDAEEPRRLSKSERRRLRRQKQRKAA